MIEELRAALKKADDDYVRAHRRAMEALDLLAYEYESARTELYTALDGAGEYWTVVYGGGDIGFTRRCYTLEDAAFFYEDMDEDPNYYVVAITKGPDGEKVPESEIFAVLGWNYAEEQA